MYDTIVIGAGQAGLAVAYYLKKTKQKFVLLEKEGEAGDSWKSRYDSLILFTPRMYSSLPGMPFEGEEQGLPNKDEMSAYLKKYRERHKIPIHFHIEVVKVLMMNDHFLIKTNKDDYQAKNVVIATGAFQTANIPSFAKDLSTDINQLHSSEYRNPNQMAAGNVLIIGAGNSGAQIAVELSKERKTYLACNRKLKYLPMAIGGKSIFWWFDKCGILKAKNTSVLGEYMQQKGDPIFGFDLKRAINKRDIVIKKGVTGGIQNEVIFEDSSSLKVNNIIWATGYKTIYPWLKMDGVMNAAGKVIHNRGVTNIKGLYFIGLPWQFRRGSALLLGVGNDAEYIVRKIDNRR
ncbi:flavin-containing monooxygenase [Bacillus benzoevorans]|uniref:Putative flavoprotein involved in K+ transport n=1 Tax=Bacillus benzoevorans TaxID=1456 RepID=A0A7X0HP66_9BACI|nr:NAD(P)/FAD-dependent oxidoreductase [Bacillus benzoevorans]MBB6444364.1 putative flavoprotein involved in K+ transport [Bacillus benzoevorans]